ncbi:MAG: radical SAM protein [Bacteroidota bacterium]|nr:radical SAM protein [Bacteroidota bacterium]
MLLRKKPVLCNYYVTYRCNAKCSFCDIWEKPSPYVTLENVEQNLVQLKKLGVKVIDFTGGEPLLHQELDKLLLLAKKYNFITTVTTNTLLYPKYAEKLKGLIDMLHFSLDSANEEKHNASRGVKCYDKFVESLQVAKSLGERPDILYTVSEKNIEEIEEVYNKFCLPNKYILILNPIFEYNGVGSKISDQQLNDLLQWGKKKYIYLNKAFITLRKDGGNHIDKPVCKAATTSIVISPFNELVMPCYHLGAEKMPINNDLIELRNSAISQYYIANEGRLPGCEGCTVNCYMQPSFSVNVNKYWLDALPSTLKYNMLKGTWKKLDIGLNKAAL